MNGAGTKSWLSNFKSLVFSHERERGQVGVGVTELDS